jgi:hypothetical protein
MLDILAMVLHGSIPTSLTSAVQARDAMEEAKEEEEEFTAELEIMIAGKLRLALFSPSLWSFRYVLTRPLRYTLCQNRLSYVEAAHSKLFN